MSSLTLFTESLPSGDTLSIEAELHLRNGGPPVVQYHVMLRGPQVCEEIFDTPLAKILYAYANTSPMPEVE